MGFIGDLFGGSPDPPQPVRIDPRETAEAQYEFGQKTALYNKQLAESTWQQTPYGTLKYEQRPAINGVPQSTMIQGLNPAEQRLLDQQRTLKGQYGDVAGQLMDKASGLYSTPIDMSQLGSMPGSGWSFSGRGFPGERPSPQAGTSNVDIVRNWAQNYKGPGATQQFDTSGLQPMPTLGATPFDTSSLGAMPVANEATRQQQLSSILERFQPQQAQDRSALETQLANQGFTMGTEGWQSSMDEINRRQNDFRLAANLQAGGEMRADLAQQLAARGQGFQELTLTENQRRANAAQEMIARGQGFQELLATSGEGRAEFAQQLSAQQQGFAQQLAAKGLNLQVWLSANNQQRADIAQQLGMRQQAIQELLLPRQQTQQELSTFMTGSQPTMPSFAPVSSQQVSVPDFAGLAATNAQMQNQANMAAYNAQMQNQGSGLGSLVGTLGGAFLGGPGGAALGSSLFGGGSPGTSTFSGAMPGSASGGGWSFV